MEQQKLELIDIYDIVYEPWWLSTWAKIAVAIVFGVLFLIACYIIYKKTRKQPVVLYWQRALGDIDSLSFADGQAFYSQLTGIIKLYLQERYALPLVDKTDSELLEILKTTQTIPSHVYDTMKELFEDVVFIKFANQHAAQERMELALKKTRELILGLENS